MEKEDGGQEGPVKKVPLYLEEKGREVRKLDDEIYEVRFCDDCKHTDKNGDEKPCSVCMQWVDGFLEATQYERG